MNYCNSTPIADIFDKQRHERCHEYMKTQAASSICVSIRKYFENEFATCLIIKKPIIFFKAKNNRNPQVCPSVYFWCVTFNVANLHGEYGFVNSGKLYKKIHNVLN